MTTLQELLREQHLTKYSEAALPRVSIIVPTYNCAQSISSTLDSLLDQNYQNLEIIAIDADSVDRTLELLEGYTDPRLRIYSVSSYNRYEMFNKGISLAQGEYLNFLFPGDFYVRPDTLRIMMTMALDQTKPQLVYSGTLLRDGRSEVKVMFRQLSLDLLKQGQQPTSLQACWFRRDIFAEIGKFRTDISLRGGFDLMCRFCLNEKLRFNALHYALTDYDLRWVTHQRVFSHFTETFKIVYSHFGFFATVAWLWKQKDISRFFKLWLRSLKGR